MLSKKMAFSLMSLITILALAFTVTPVMAVGEFSVAVTGPTQATYTLNATGDEATEDVTISLMVETGQPIGDLGYTGTPAVRLLYLRQTLIEVRRRRTMHALL
jgi:uncharacterized protein (UPF0333 family)